MVGVWGTTTRHATHLTRLSSPKTSIASLDFCIHQRCFTTGADHQNPPKVNFWQDPLHPSKWKEEHFVIVSLAGWATMIYGGYKFFVGNKKDKKDEKVAEKSK